MKLFWALIGLLVLGTVALLASGVLSENSGVIAPPAKVPTESAPPASPIRTDVSIPSDAVAEPANQETTKASAPPPPHAIVSAQTAQPSAPATVQASAPPVAENPTATVIEEANKPEPPKAVAPPAVLEPAKPASAPPDAANPLIALRKEIEAERAAEVAQHGAPKAAPAIPAAPPAPATVAANAADSPFAGAQVETKPDGSLLIDGKYIVKGKGTQEDPYKVTWDQLVSAQNEYAPKEGRKTIPPRIQALDGKWLDITGYVTFPLMTTESDELLSMMNQWDGCCIGVPPTPYDAVEVRLANAVSGNARLATYGSVRGKFKVDPHLVGGWLVGLYVMDQAKLTPVAYGGIAP